MSAASEHSATGEASREGRKGGVRQFFGDMLDGLQFARALRLQAEQRGLPTSNLTNPQEWLINAMNGGPTKSGAKVNQETAFNVAAVRACVNFRANLIAIFDDADISSAAFGGAALPDLRCVGAHGLYFFCACGTCIRYFFVRFFARFAHFVGILLAFCVGIGYDNFDVFGGFLAL